MNSHTRIPVAQRGTRPELGQALTEALIVIAVIGLLLASIRIFSKISSADEMQISEARWLSFHCAFRDEFCSQLPEAHHSNQEPEERTIAKADFDAGSSLLRRHSKTLTITDSPESLASKFGLEVRDGFHLARVSHSLELQADALKFGLPARVELAPRQLAILSAPWSLPATIEGDEETLQMVKRGIKLPGQESIDVLLQANEMARDLLRFLGLETLEAKWSSREIRTLDRQSLPISAPESDCYDCERSQ